MAQETITFDDELAPVLTRVKAEHGPGVVDELVTNWLRDHQNRQETADFEDVKAGRADPSVRARLRSRLGF